MSIQVSLVNETDVPSVTRKRASQYDSTIEALRNLPAGKAIKLSGGTPRNAATIVALARRRGVMASYVNAKDGVYLTVSREQKAAPAAEKKEPPKRKK